LVERTLNKQFWYGDSSGTIFEIDLGSATLKSDNGVTHLTIVGTVSNLLTVPSQFHFTGILAEGSSRARISSGSARNLDYGRKYALLLSSDRVNGGLSIDQSTLTFGPNTGNRVRLSLAASTESDQVPPVQGFIDSVDRTIAPGATCQIVSSMLYPDFGFGRSKLYRLRVVMEVGVAPPLNGRRLYLHPSITLPDGSTVSIGDQYTTSTSNSFIETHYSTHPLKATTCFRSLSWRPGRPLRCRSGLLELLAAAGRMPR